MEVDLDVSDVDQLSEVNVMGYEGVQVQINVYGFFIGVNFREICCEIVIVIVFGLLGIS